ncbi:MAG: hypothetical protein ACUVTN_07660, partial [Thermodesulfobacteriota bacterium]
MAEIFVLVEHRQGKIRDITYEMLGMGENLAKKERCSLTALLLGYGIKEIAEELSTRVEKVLVVEDEKLNNFNSIFYQNVLSFLVSRYQPLLLLIGHTAYGMDLSPSLSVELDIP